MSCTADRDITSQIQNWDDVPAANPKSFLRPLTEKEGKRIRYSRRESLPLSNFLPPGINKIRNKEPENECAPRGPRAADARGAPAPARACKEKAAWSSGVPTFLGPFSVGPVSRQDGVLVSSTFGGTYPGLGQRRGAAGHSWGGGA